MLLYSDATGRGSLAWVAESSSERRWASISVPSWLHRWALRRRNQVATWELVAALCGLWDAIEALAEDGPQWEVHLFMDNTMAKGTLLRGSSRQRNWNALVAEIWFRAAEAGLVLHAWFVPSAQNLADAPTRKESKREEMARLRDLGFEEVDWRWPAH